MIFGPLQGIQCETLHKHVRQTEADTGKRRGLLDADEAGGIGRTPLEGFLAQLAPQRGFGFNPLLVSCSRELLAGVLRPGNAARTVPMIIFGGVSEDLCRYERIGVSYLRTRTAVSNQIQGLADVSRSEPRGRAQRNAGGAPAAGRGWALPGELAEQALERVRAGLPAGELPEEAREQLADGLIDGLLTGRRGEAEILGPGGLLGDPTRRLVERAASRAS
jgi:hypothetical protein